MMRAGILFIAICAQVAVLCCGCRSVNSHRVVSAIPLDAADASCVSEHAGLVEAASRHGVSIYWNGPSGSNDSEQQIVLAERAIEQGDMGLVLTPNALYALDTVIQRALAHGLPVVIFGSPITLSPDPNLSFVLNDVQRAGRLTAERIHRIVGDEAEIAIVDIDPTLPGSIDNAKAFETSLEQIAPRIRIVKKLMGPYTSGQTERATEQLLDEYPHLAAIYALNSPASFGAVAGVRNSRAERRVRVIGSSQTQELLYFLRHGAIDSLVVQDMRGMGAQAVENIVARRSGRSVATTTYREPVLLTRDNIDTEEMQQRLKMDWRQPE